MTRNLCFSFLCTAIISLSALGQKKDDAYSQMLDYSRPNGHHQVLGLITGKWAFHDAERPFVKGTIVRKSIYEGRFYQVEMIGGKLPLPVADGKMKEDNYQSLQIEGYDNGKGKYVATSINNHIGSDIEMQLGAYDSALKTITYSWEEELIRGDKKNNRRVLKFVDNNRYTEEYYEEQAGQFVKVRELVFTKLNEN